MNPPSRGDEASCVATAVAEIEARRMPGLSDGAAIPGLERLVLDALSAPGKAGMDRLRLTAAPLVPEVRLLLAEDAVVLWARLEAEAGHALPPPFWASAWAGGQALARYVLDHAATVAGRHVLDLASGSGLVAIAAAIAGARVVTANDVDPYAIAAISANAHANGIDMALSSSDLLDGDGDGVEVVLAGDVLYDPTVAARMLPFLARAVAKGSQVLVGDPDRGHLPHDWLKPVATYQVLVGGNPEDAQLNRTSVLEAEHEPEDERSTGSRGRGAASNRLHGAVATHATALHLGASARLGARPTELDRTAGSGPGIGRPDRSPAGQVTPRR